MCITFYHYYGCSHAGPPHPRPDPETSVQLCPKGQSHDPSSCPHILYDKLYCGVCPVCEHVKQKKTEKEEKERQRDLKDRIEKWRIDV